MSEEEKSEDQAQGAEKAPEIIQRRVLTFGKNLIDSWRMDWETLAWAAILILAIASRFYALGARGMSHDESLHALYSHNLSRSGSYQHDPMMHGPFLFHANALVFLLLGATDATARVIPALAGIGSVMMAWFYRRWLGRLGALLAGLLMLVSPSLLFHSRYIRNDIYIVLFAMIWVYGIFRFVEDRRMKWLYLTVTTMALGFAAKENQFMSGAIFGAFLVGAALWRWYTGRESLRDSPFADLAVLFLTLVLPFAAPFGHLLLGWDALAYSSSEDLTRSVLLVVLMTMVSLVIAILWFIVAKGNRTPPDASDADGPPQAITFADWATLMLLFWAIAILLFTTLFTNAVNGFATGVVGSLGYWLGQQEVQRGSQPWYYYIMQGLLYELLPLFLSLGALALVLWRFGTRRWRALAEEEMQTPAAAEKKPHPVEAEMPSEFSPASALVRPYVILFLAWWVLAAWLAYSYAGERMPWLMTHIAQPMTLFGGWWGARMAQRVDWRKLQPAQWWWLLALLPLLLFMLAPLFDFQPASDQEPDALARTARILRLIAVSVGLLGLAALAFSRLRWRQTLRLAVVLVGALLLLLTVRFSYLLTYVNYDMATEYLVYAHASPDVKRALREIETISESTVGGRDVQVAYDDVVAWPMTWYMRFFPNSIFYGANPNSDAMSVQIILVGDSNYDKVEPYVVRDYVSRNYRLVWWPEESYKGEWNEEKGRPVLTLAQIWGALTEPERRSRLWQIFFYRNHPDRTLTAWPHRREFRLYLHKDIADIVWDPSEFPVVESVPDAPSFDYEETDRSASHAYSGPYADLTLITPRALAVGPDGRRYILDTGNNRVVVLNPDGSFALAFGGVCFLDNVEDSGCADPDGDGPLEMGDGQFREPWGIAVAADGAIFVADTWNGRIQSFDSDGNFRRKWGYFSIITDDNKDPFSLFGPRGLAILPSGNLLVADTGNKRLLEFTASGDYVRQVGGGGVLLGRFDEPVDVAVHPPTGNILVSDVWNRRIQALSADLEPLAEWPMPTWNSQEIWDKPYLAAAADGAIYATDPQFSQVFVISEDGVVQASFGRFGGELNRFARPTGIAIDPLTGEMLIADADNNRILIFENE